MNMVRLGYGDAWRSTMSQISERAGGSVKPGTFGRHGLASWFAAVHDVA